MKYVFVLPLLCSLAWGNEQYVLTDSAMIDFENDQNPELMVLYTVVNPEDTKNGSRREFFIYKSKGNGQLTPWFHSSTAVLGTDANGTDTFMGMSFENDVLTIKHFGGDRIKWNYTDKYRLQDDQLILVSHLLKSFDGGCHFQEFDYNLRTGAATYTQNKTLQEKVSNCEDGVKTLQASGNFTQVQPITIEHRDKFDPYEIMSKLERLLYSEQK